MQAICRLTSMCELTQWHSAKISKNSKRSLDLKRV